MNRRDVLAAATAASVGAVAVAQDQDAPVRQREPLCITRLEMFLVQLRWLFLKVHTNAKIAGAAII